ncbi:ThuA domain-containing protein [Anaeromicropila populeti]|uniref:Trehalose utilization protein n=1 Tax=Anaeromicropila populeti TaxID=37658 RepID=A0A1I6INA4_9FIRM|nr:ThuA domain-containing protein [Anaeromicropila populeti]SFR68109.1 Trehalose utilization protein [Anaeromicropila populeti]
MIRVTIWNEFIHERENEKIKEIYPQGIHGCIKSFLERNEDMEITCRTLDMPNQGLEEDILRKTDVLIWWSHIKQEELTDENARRVQKYVQRGMGFIGLHSAHFSKVLKALLGTSMTLKWRHGDKERLWCINKIHPIAKGIPECITLPKEEMYGEYFDIPAPDDIIFLGWFSGGEVFRSGVTFHSGYGKIFYFQPGHEEYPIYHIDEIQRIIINAVYWAYQENKSMEELECTAVEKPME